MANLFFIHTPLQLMVSQQIIRQEKLHNNVMLYGYVDDNSHFLKIYDLTVIDELWSARVEMPNVSSWAIISRRHLIRDGYRSLNSYQFIRRLIRDYQIDAIFMGDIQNLSCQLAALCFHHKGLKVGFFEEGSSHYIMRYGFGKRGSILDKVYAVIMDVVYYLPFYGIPFCYNRYWKGITLSNLPMDIRFSLVPFYHESFDRLIEYQPLFSPKLLEFIREEIKQLDSEHSTLLLTSPFYINGVDDDPIPYIKTIIDYAKTAANAVLHIKFHPRETKSVRESILSQLDRERIRYVLLGKSLNIPIEYYLQFIQYDKIVMFLCSTSFYNGYLFPKTEFVSILPDYYENCKRVGSPNARYIENLLNSMKDV